MAEIRLKRGEPEETKTLCQTRGRTNILEQIIPGKKCKDYAEAPDFFSFFRICG